MSKDNKRAKRKAMWEGHIKAWEESGLTIIAYCEQNKISQSTLYYWRDKLNKKQRVKSTSFIPVRMRSLSATEPSEHIIIKLSSMAVQIPIAMGIDEIVNLLRGLGERHD